MIWNKKAQIGRIISALPILFFVALIMLGFLLFSALLSMGNSARLEISSLNSETNPFLLHEVVINGEIMPLFKALILMENEEIGRDSVDEVLKGLVADKEDYCFCYQSPSGGLILAENVYNEEDKQYVTRVTSFSTKCSQVANLMSESNYVLNGNGASISSYYGKCPAEAEVIDGI